MTRVTDRDWPLGVALRGARGSLSVRAAARAAGISEGRWRQIEAGYQLVGRGLRVPTNPRDETIIAVAEAVGLDVDEALRLAGREPRRSVGAARDDRRHVGRHLDLRDVPTDVLLDEIARRAAGSHRRSRDTS